MTQSGGVQLLAEKAQQELWHALRTGKLRDGQFLSMSQLVQILDCPIAAVREAVKQASSHGLLATLPKRGVQVMEARPEIIRNCLDFRMVLDQEGARRRIAGSTLSGLKDLRVQHNAMLDTARAELGSSLPPKAIEVDLSLHNFLAEGLDNSQLTASYEANRMRISIIQNARPFLQNRIVSAMEEHLTIIEALESRDTKGAVNAIRYHCEQTQRWWGVA
ncbi:GntR family transcriptional regulator [Leisingera sp. M658]|uniref:GntR family transcriptional regulator n=1 Tax=Leisingera sp. M658 TaxID=2867015 RepID=UPI0021A7604D|nr:GntR family transcriptional regulator [Leisingera sp. M658]UWQ75845.1 GntR family transcriptional regulator [Leisingera sp. M658]